MDLKFNILIRYTLLSIFIILYLKNVNLVQIYKLGNLIVKNITFLKIYLLYQ